MPYIVHRRRMGRAEQRVQAAMAQRAADADADASEPTVEIVDLPALHRSLAIKRKAIPILVAFARELVGMPSSVSSRAEREADIPALASSGAEGEADIPAPGSSRTGASEAWRPERGIFPPPPSSGEVPSSHEGGGVMTRSDRTPDQSAEPPPPDPPPRVRFEYRNGSMIAIDTVTGGLADSATALAALGQLPR